MIPVHDVLAFGALLLLMVAGGFLLGFLRDRRARRDVVVAGSGRSVTVPLLVGAGGRQLRARGVVDAGALRVLGRGVHLAVDRATWEAATVRRGRLDDELLDFAEQRGFVDAAGARYLLGPVEEWSAALESLLAGPPRSASRLRLLLAAVPRSAVLPAVAAVLGFAVFQGIWWAGHDVGATVVRVVGEPGLESCAVRWSEQGRAEYAEVDCYAPFPKPGDGLVVRALAWPFDGSAMDHEDTYPMASLLLGGAALAIVATGTAVASTRLRRPAVRLSAEQGAQLRVVPAEPLTVRSDADLSELLAALAAKEAWDGEVVADPPVQPWYAPYLLARGAARWWPGLVLAGAALLVEGVALPWRVALTAGAVVALGWALVRALVAWFAIRRSLGGPVTSEWDYWLVRSVEDEWFALLVLGVTPHWMVLLDGPGHPPARGRCGVRGDLREGGAVQLRIGDGYWPTLSPVTKVDATLVADICDDVRDRLQPTGREAAPPQRT